MSGLCVKSVETSFIVKACCIYWRLWLAVTEATQEAWNDLREVAVEQANFEDDEQHILITIERQDSLTK